MSRCGGLYENKVTGERAVVPRGDQDAHGRSGLVHLTVQPRGVVVGEQVHPQPDPAVLAVAGLAPPESPMRVVRPDASRDR